LYCSRRYGFDVSDVLTNNSRFILDTIHSCARSEVTEVQMHEVDLLFEFILIRDGQAALPCWFPRSDVQTIVNYSVSQKKTSPTFLAVTRGSNCRIFIIFGTHVTEKVSNQ